MTLIEKEQCKSGYGICQRERPAQMTAGKIIGGMRGVIMYLDPI